MNDASSTAGACTPTPSSAMMNPSVAAIEYAGAVEATPITTFDRKPIALFFSPLSSTVPVAGAPDTANGAPGAAMLSVAIGLLWWVETGLGCRDKSYVLERGAAMGAIPKPRAPSCTFRTLDCRVVDHVAD